MGEIDESVSCLYVAAGKASAVVGRPNGHALHSLPVSVIWQG